jgi:hypothetical protein
MQLELTKVQVHQEDMLVQVLHLDHLTSHHLLDIDMLYRFKTVV